MSGFVCPHCRETFDIFKSGGEEHMAGQMKVPFLGRVPIDPAIVLASDSGNLYMFHYTSTKTARAFGEVIRPILEMQSFMVSTKGENT